MKKIFMIIISALLIVLLGLGAVGYYIEKDEVAQAQESNVEENTKEEGKEESNLVIDVNKLDITKIENYTMDKNATISGMGLPYTIAKKDMQIINVGKYEGKFIEDGSDSKKSNVLAMVIKNTSDKVINYGEVKINVAGTTNTIKFIVTNLKPNASALVMESTGKVKFNSDNKYQYISATNTMEDSLSLMKDKIVVTTKGKKITVKNISNKNLDTVYVYYKNGTGGNCYLGGITYRVKFTNLKAGESKTENTLHFSNDNSEIVKIESVYKTE